MKYIITGGKKLEGEITVSGNKNAIFPCVAAALLTDDEVVLENVSDLSDSRVLIKILSSLGVEIKQTSSQLTINASSLKGSALPKDLMTKLRGSIVLVGALLGRLGKVKFYHPGGDIIGQRSINTHLEGFKSLGANYKKNDLEYSLNFRQNRKNTKIFLAEASVTATENLILAAALGKGRVIIRNYAKEPHVLDLCKMLSKMGGKISQVGDRLEITGVPKLHGVKYKLGCDFIEMGTYLVAGAISGGEITIKGLDQGDLNPVLEPLKRFNLRIRKNLGSITVLKSNLKAVPRLQTNIWPGFPTDLMSAAIVLATQSKGVTLCHDWMYESRMFFVDKLISMGAQIILADPHRSLVYGPTKLRGRILDTPDIRAGMALVLAALVAKGESVISQAELIERGYEDVYGKLKKLGAIIQREE